MYPKNIYQLPQVQFIPKLFGNSWVKRHPKWALAKNIN